MEEKKGRKKQQIFITYLLSTKNEQLKLVTVKIWPRKKKKDSPIN